MGDPIIAPVSDGQRAAIALAVRAQRERDAQVCRERATRARDYPQSQAGYETAIATAREAEACAEAIRVERLR